MYTLIRMTQAVVGKDQKLERSKVISVPEIVDIIHFQSGRGNDPWLFCVLGGMKMRFRTAMA